MLLLALLLQAAAGKAPPQAAPPQADVIVRAPLPASPQQAATIVVEPAAMLIATFDSDGDALVERFELNEGIARVFGPAPMRYIAYSDWALRWLGDRAALPSPYEVDRNNDDSVTLQEMQDHFSRLYARYDTNRDGAIDRAELLTFRASPIGGGPVGAGKPPKK